MGYHRETLVSYPRVFSTALSPDRSGLQDHGQRWLLQRHSTGRNDGLRRSRWRHHAGSQEIQGVYFFPRREYTMSDFSSVAVLRWTPDPPPVCRLARNPSRMID